MEDRFETFTVLIARISRSIRRLKAEEMERLGLKGPHVSCLYYLSLYDELTAAELSRRTGIDAGILRKIMTGRETAVSTRNLMTLARYFGLSMQELIDAFSGQ